MISYKVNSVVDGKANIDVTLGDQVFNQDVLLPDTVVEAEATLKSYVEQYAKDLMEQEQPKEVANPLQELIGIEKPVTVSKEVSAYVEARVVEAAAEAEAVDGQ